MFVNKNYKLLFSGLIFIFLFSVVAPALAVQNIVDPWGDSTIKDKIQEETGLGEKDPRSTAAILINVLLGFLGIIAVGLILLAGFKWMTAGGEEEKVTDAKKMLIAGVIGLIIIVSAFALATFVLRSLVSATAD